MEAFVKYLSAIIFRDESLNNRRKIFFRFVKIQKDFCIYLQKFQVNTVRKVTIDIILHGINDYKSRPGLGVEFLTFNF